MIEDPNYLTDAYLLLMVMSEIVRTIAIVIGVIIAALVHKDKLHHNPRFDNDHNKRERRIRK